MDITSIAGTVVEYGGREWKLGAPSVTSDGFVTAWGTTVDKDDGPVEGHSFFLGRAPQ